ncbi:MAG: Rossmann-like and DUF2520 domain-containing protein [Actinomycetota bacterium]
MDLAVVGAGRVGTALAVLWRGSGHRIVAVAGGAATPERAALHLPGVPVLDNVAAARGAGVVVIATPDGVIAGVCEELSGSGSVGPGVAVAHASGAVGLDALGPARSAGAAVLSIHPLQTCPTVDAALERIPGAGFAITADDEGGFALGERLAREAGGRPFRIADAMKPLYHAAAVFASNYLVGVTAIAHELFDRAADGDDAAALLAPLQEATLANVARVGPAAALTGPAVRGDAQTVARNLEALAEHAPDAVRPYVALADLTLELAQRTGRLPASSRDAVEEVLARWR